MGVVLWVVRLALRLVPRAWREDLERDLVEESRRDARGAVWVAAQTVAAAGRLRASLLWDRFACDARIATRGLARTPAFTAGATLTFALGIGLNLAAFNAVDRVLLRSLPYADPDRVFLLQEYDVLAGEAEGTVRSEHLSLVRARLGDVLQFATTGPFDQRFTLTPVADRSARLSMLPVTREMLSLLGVAPVIGRDFTDDDVRARRSVVLLAYETWQRRLNGRPDVVGQRLWQGEAYGEVIGVLPAGFVPPRLPLVDGLVLFTSGFEATRPGGRLQAPIVRVAADAPLDGVERELQAMATEVQASLPPARSGRAVSRTTLRLDPLHAIVFGRYTSYLWLVTLAAGLVMLIGCANLGTLFLVRSRARSMTTTVQAALGASRRRLLMGQAMEGGLLAAGGAATAMLALAWTGELLNAQLPPVFQRYSQSALTPRSLAAAVGLSAACAILATAWPARRSARPHLRSALAGSHTTPTGRQREGALLAAVESALAVLLVSGAVLTTRSFVGLATTDLGWRPAGLYHLSADGATALDAARIVDTLRAVPGVEHVAAADRIPSDTLVFSRPGDVSVAHVTPDFFMAVGNTLLAGRWPGPADVESGLAVAWVSRAAGRALLPWLEPEAMIGRPLPPPHGARLVAGVVSDVRPEPAIAAQPWLYVLGLDPSDGAEVVLRGDARQAPALFDVTRGLEASGLGVGRVTLTPYPARIQESLRDQRFRSSLFGLFGLVGLVLSAVGLYAMTACDLLLRSREIGIRLALGATPGRVVGRAVGAALRPVGIGVAVGLLAFWWVSRVLDAFLHDVDARDPWTFGAVALVLVATSAIAAWLPARRAARTDPASVLRAV